MDSQKRLMLALALSFVVVISWNLFFGPKAGPTTQLGGATDAGAVATAPSTPAPSALVAAAYDAGPEAPPVVTVERELPKVHVALSTDGAGLSRAQLQGAKMRENEHYSVVEGLQHAIGARHNDSPQVDLALPVPGLALPLAVSVEGAAPLPSSVRFALAAEQTPRKVVMAGAYNGWKITKTFEWPADDGELLRLTVALQNASAQPAAGELSVHYVRAVDPSTEEKGSFFGGVGNQWRPTCRVGKDVQAVVPNDKDKPPAEFKGPVEFFGVDQQYFLAAVIPQVDQREGRCVLFASATERTVTASFPISVAPGEQITRTFDVYLGPKDSARLASVAAPEKAGGAAVDPSSGPHLESAVDFGWLVVICKVLLAIMKFFYGVFGNWGLAIIFLTVLVKLVLLPLTFRQMVSAEQMKKLQPRIEEIKKKWPDDRERQNVETMKLYQEAKVNPLGGCFPLLVQMPVWFALFRTLRASVEIYREPFISPLWADLTYKDPSYLLPLALGVTMILTQRLQPQMSMDPMQAKLMTYVMPAFFTLLMLNYPAGLALYIFTNNLLTIAQTYGLKRYLRSREATR
jgi:YidC/Oxa1 family membrane protein insertase